MTSHSKAKLVLPGQKVFNIDSDGGRLSVLGGLLPAAWLAKDTRLIEAAAGLISDPRKAENITFPVSLLLAQRVFLATSGQPDAIDCTIFKDDPALNAVLLGRHGVQSLPSQPTASRFEQSVTAETIEKLEAFPLRYFIEKQSHKPRRLTIYIDGTAIRTFGTQEKSVWRGGYKQTQYFPLIATTAEGDLLLAQLRAGSHSDSKSADTIVKLIQDIQVAWKDIKLTVVMDTGFNSPGLLSRLEKLEVKYVIGYPSKSSLKSKIKDVILAVQKEFERKFGKPLYIGKGKTKIWQKEHERIRSLPTNQRSQAEKDALRRHVRIIYGIKHNGTKWDEDRDVIVRVDFSDKGLDVRSVVTNMDGTTADQIYEEHYCKRSRVEMFIKEAKSHCKVPLSCQSFTANQFRFTTIQGLAYMLLNEIRQRLPFALRRLSLISIRNRILLVPVRLLETERRIRWHLSSVHPDAALIIHMCKKFQARTA